MSGSEEQTAPMSGSEEQTAPMSGKRGGHG
jgi:hypothetical protein